MKSVVMSDRGMGFLRVVRMSCVTPAILALWAIWIVPAGSPLAAQGLAASAAFGASADLQAVPFFGDNAAVASSPLPKVGGGAEAAYARTGSVVAVSLASAPTGPILRTGRLEAGASSEMPDAVPTRARAAAQGMLLTLGHAIPLLSLDVRTLRSAAGIDGSCGSGLTASASSTLTGVNAAGSLGRDLVVPSHPAPNTVLIDAAGVRIVLNEQTRMGDGFDELAITVSAVHIYLHDALLSGLGRLSGEIVIARSQASVRCSSGPVTKADLALTGFASRVPVALGGRLVHTFRVTNQGFEPATAVVFAGTPPAGLKAVSATAGQGSCGAGTPIVCTLGDLEPGQSVDVIIEGIVEGTVAEMAGRTAGPLIDRAVVTSGVGDPDAANNALALRTPRARGDHGERGDQTLGAAGPRATVSPAPSGRASL